MFRPRPTQHGVHALGMMGEGTRSGDLKSPLFECSTREFVDQNNGQLAIGDSNREWTRTCALFIGVHSWLVDTSLSSHPCNPRNPRFLGQIVTNDAHRKDIIRRLKAMFGSARNTAAIAGLLTLIISAAMVSPTASAIADNAVIGWDGDKHGVIEHLNGSYRIRRDEGAPPASHPPLLPFQTAKTYDISFGIYDNNPSPTPSCTPLGTSACPPLPTPKVLWYNEKNPPDPYTVDGGYLPCLVTRFERPTQQCYRLDF